MSRNFTFTEVVEELKRINSTLNEIKMLLHKICNIFTLFIERIEEFEEERVLKELEETIKEIKKRREVLT